MGIWGWNCSLLCQHHLIRKSDSICMFYSCCFPSSLPAPPLLLLPFLWMLWLCQGENGWKQLSLLLRWLKPKSQVISSFFSGWLLESIFGFFSDPCLLGVDRKVKFFSPKSYKSQLLWSPFPANLTHPLSPVSLDCTALFYFLQELIHIWISGRCALFFFLFSLSQVLWR